MTDSDAASAPLLPSHARSYDASSSPPPPSGSGLRARLAHMRAAAARSLSSRRKHFAIMAIVSLDVFALLVEVFIRLIACETGQAREPWVLIMISVLGTIGLVISCLFMVELAACLLVYGFGYLCSWFHLFDAVVIVISFIVDVGLRGVAGSIGSLVVVLRLWRLAKLSEEVVLGASERMDLLEHHLEEVQSENKQLRAQLGLDSVDHSSHA
ncbi:hypothetical protein XA68_12142 [Ophiocordyceps unilateralis]|uniref:Voltage-gated hydrogen channel 1 n=1 Tax=Ophiocordyceps unilateralis TaxID=268505 RepID=A0A2A9PEC9_OPHUN|nr:hypothetical protein XA68_12142 [Ophiocordyceps unilateralis]